MEMIYEWLADLAPWLYRLIRPFTHPKSPMFFPYILSAIAIGLLVQLHTFRALGKQSIRKALGSVFSKEVYTHPSSLDDYKFYFFSRLINFFIFTFLGFLSLHLIAILPKFFTLILGPSPQLTPKIELLLLLTLGGMLFHDFLKFFGHLLRHKIKFLWQFHKIHHSAEVLNIFTFYRHHPVDIFFQLLLNVVFMGYDLNIM